MKDRILAALVMSAMVLVPAAFAQQSGTQSEPAQPAAVSSQVGQVEVTGTIVTLTANRIEVKVDAVTAPQGTTTESTVMIGKTTPFTLNSSTEMPQGMQVGNRVDLWFKDDNGSLLATRLALAVSADQPAGTNESASTSQSSGVSASSPSDQSSTSGSGVTGSNSSGEQPASTAEPSSSTAAAKSTHRENLPKTGSPLPLIGLVGLAALASVLVLRFVLRV